MIDTNLKDQTRQWLDSFNGNTLAAKSAVQTAPEDVRRDLLKHALQVEDIAESYNSEDAALFAFHRESNAIESLFDKHPSIFDIVRIPPLKGKTKTNTPSAHIIAASNTFEGFHRRSKQSRVQRRIDNFLRDYGDGQWEVIPTCRKSTKIFRHGPPLNMTHFVLWQRLVDSSLVHGFGARLELSTSELIKDLDLSCGGVNYEYVHSCLNDLSNTILHIVRRQNDVGGRETLSKLVVILAKEFSIDPSTGKAVVRLDPDLIKLFDNDEYKLIRWETIHRLVHEPLAMKLLTYFGTTSMKEQHWLIDSLYEGFGAGVERRKFIYRLKLAMTCLIDTKEIAAFYLEPSQPSQSTEKRHVIVWTDGLTTELKKKYGALPGCFYAGSNS